MLSLADIVLKERNQVGVGGFVLLTNKAENCIIGARSIQLHIRSSRLFTYLFTNWRHPGNILALFPMENV